MANPVQWFTVTSSIRKAVELINSVDDSKLKKLLNRIVQKIHLKNERSFSEEEEEKLQAAFNLSAKETESILDTISFILEQAAYHNAKPNMLNQQLQTVQLEETKIQCFVSTWVEHGVNVIEIFRKRTLAPKQLETVNWQLRLQTGQANKSKMKIPSAVLEVGLAVPDIQGKEKLQMEFTHEELYNFFQQLEGIQTQLDALNR